LNTSEPIAPPKCSMFARSTQRIAMRLIPALLLAWLGLASPLILPEGALIAPASAQSIEVGGGVRVAAAAGSRVNVRGQPEVRPDNVVTVAQGGDLLRVDEAAERGAFTWYRVSTLAGSRPAYSGWIRGDLLAAAALPEPTLPQVLAETVERPAPAEAPEVTEEAGIVPFDMRTDWSRNILTLYPAIEGCVSVGSAPPITVLRATARSRGLAEVIMSDAAGRRWDCVIRETGGTPIRYDPLSGSVFLRDRIAQEPFFSTQEERPGLDPACYRFERVTDPSTDAHLGWLYYRTCP
jgi:hypothetical protein